MEVQLKYLVIGSFVLFLVGTACGYFALPAKVVTKTETKVVTQIVKDTSQDKENHLKVVIVEEKKPDGTVVTTTTKTQDTDTKTNTDTKINKDQDTTTDKEVMYAKNSLTINALAATQIGDTSGVLWGLQVTRKLIGPIQIGVFGLTNRTLGGSLGISF